MQTAIGDLRVSTQEPGRSALTARTSHVREARHLTSDAM